MALFNDGDILSIQDLRIHETGILDTAHLEGVDLSWKLKLAHEELGIELAAFVARAGDGSWGGPTGDLSKVVVTPPLRKWYAFYTLALVYRDLYYNQLNDRYKQKWHEYSKLASRASALLYEIGVGIVDNPVPRAAAPALTTVAGPHNGATYFVCVTWVNTAGEEGAPSSTVTIATPDGSAPVVRATGSPPGASGWNVYVGLSAEELGLQNNGPIVIGQAWALPEAGLQTGRHPGDGQAPNRFLKLSRTFLRG